MNIKVCNNLPVPPKRFIVWKQPGGYSEDDIIAMSILSLRRMDEFVVVISEDEPYEYSWIFEREAKIVDDKKSKVYNIWQQEGLNILRFICFDAIYNDGTISIEDTIDFNAFNEFVIEELINKCENKGGVFYYLYSGHIRWRSLDNFYGIYQDLISYTHTVLKREIKGLLYKFLAEKKK